MQEIYLGKLCRGGTRNPTGVDISTTRHNKYGGHIFGCGEDDSGNIFASYLFLKTKYLPPIVGALSTILVKKYGLGLLNTVTPTNDQYPSLYWVGADSI